jgi:hypothetical protein
MLMLCCRCIGLGLHRGGCPRHSDGRCACGHHRRHVRNCDS